MPWLNMVEKFIDWCGLDFISVINITRKIKKYFREKDSMLILGYQGVGKTQFCKSLIEVLADTVDVSDTTITTVVNKIRINKKYFNVIDTPGNPDSSQEHELLRVGDENKKCSLLVILSCYGFFELRGREIANKPSREQLEEFLSKNREKEIEKLKRISLYWGFFRPKKVLVVINKADLWKSYGKIQVLRHYMEGEYNEVLKKSIPPNTSIKYLPYCSILRKYYNLKEPSINTEEIKKYRKELFHYLKNC